MRYLLQAHIWLMSSKCIRSWKAISKSNKFFLYFWIWCRYKVACCGGKPYSTINNRKKLFWDFVIFGLKVFSTSRNEINNLIILRFVWFEFVALSDINFYLGFSELNIHWPHFWLIIKTHFLGQKYHFFLQNGSFNKFLIDDSPWNFMPNNVFNFVNKCTSMGQMYLRTAFTYFHIILHNCKRI